MKNLLKNIWDAPASSIAGAIVAALAVITGADLEWPKWIVVSLMSVSAFLAFISGPNNGKAKPGINETPTRIGE